MSLTPDQFRLDFPEFSDAAAYPDALLTLWLGAAANFVNAERWGAVTTLGLALVAAHFIVTAARDRAAANAGAAPGEVQGLRVSKSAGELSTSFDVSSVTRTGDGFWNTTSYGIRYRQLLRLFGAGGMQLPALGVYC